MERLWAPWRLAYVTGAGEAGSRDCVFCLAQTAPAAEPLVLFRGPRCFVVLNLYPYSSGHLLVVPNRHTSTLASLTREEAGDLMVLTQRAEIALTEVYRPAGLNVGLNLGRPAGAGVEEHLHVHAVPRWNGDTSFMSVIGEVRVLPEELGQTAARLRPIFERLDADASGLGR